MGEFQGLFAVVVGFFFAMRKQHGILEDNCLQCEGGANQEEVVS